MIYFGLLRFFSLKEGFVSAEGTLCRVIKKLKHEQIACTSI